MAFSLPGISRDEKMTVSPSPNTTLGWSPWAIRVRAARGSPWLPVQIRTILSSGRKPASFSVTKGSGGVR